MLLGFLRSSFFWSLAPFLSAPAGLLLFGEWLIGGLTNRTNRTNCFYHDSPQSPRELRTTGRNPLPFPLETWKNDPGQRAQSSRTPRHTEDQQLGLITLPETNIAPENGWFEDEWLVSFRDGWKWQVLCLLVSGRVNAYYGIDFQTNMTAALTF